MNNYSPRQYSAVVALIAFLTSVPFLVGAIYDTANPLAVAVDDGFVPTYEQFKITTYDKLSNSGIQRLIGVSEKEINTLPLKSREEEIEAREEANLRRTYDNIAAEHWKLVTAQTRRHLSMCGALALASIGYLLFVWVTFRGEKSEGSKPPHRRGIYIKPRDERKP